MCLHHVQLLLRDCTQCTYANPAMSCFPVLFPPPHRPKIALLAERATPADRTYLDNAVLVKEGVTFTQVTIIKNPQQTLRTRA